MKLFLDTADSQALREWISTGIVDGVTTNPTNLSKQGGDPVKQIKEICALFADGHVSVEVTVDEPNEVYQQAHALAALSKNIVVKIPCHKKYYAVIKKLVEQGMNINVTLVFTLLQGLMMCKLGVLYISPFVGRLDDIDVEGLEILQDLRHMIDTYGFSTQILAASLRDIRHLHHAVQAGADVATVPVSVLEKVTQHVLTDHGIAMFNADWQKLGVKQFP